MIKKKIMEVPGCSGLVTEHDDNLNASQYQGYGEGFYHHGNISQPIMFNVNQLIYK